MLSKLGRSVEDMQDLDGRGVFTSETLVAIEKLKHHILTGCLSDIPPGGGTNRNERLHCLVHKVQDGYSIGILATDCFISCPQYTIDGRKVSKPINVTGIHGCQK